MVLSETHSKGDVEVQQWVQEGAGRGRPWQGRSFWCHNMQLGSQQPVRGVAVLLRDGVVPLGVEVQVQHRDSVGRLLRVGWECGDSTRWSVLAVYAPSDSADRTSFFIDDYWAALQSGDANSNLLVGGDFNCACSPEDVLPMPGQQPQASSRLIGGTSLSLVNSLFGLVDCYRHLHPRRLQPTHYQQSLLLLLAAAAAVVQGHPGTVAGLITSSCLSRLCRKVGCVQHSSMLVSPAITGPSASTCAASGTPAR